MSLESWKNEFYPVEASKDHSDIAAIEHAILKWTGYTEENLKKHELTSDGAVITDSDNNVVIFATNSCSLCLKYWANDCDKCPLYLIGESCISSHHESNISPYRKTMNNSDPSYILDALKKALIYARENS